MSSDAGIPIIIATTDPNRELSISEAALLINVPKTRLYNRKQLNPVWAQAFWKEGDGSKESHWITTPALIAEAQRRMPDKTHGLESFSSS